MGLGIRMTDPAEAVASPTVPRIMERYQNAYRVAGTACGLGTAAKAILLVSLSVSAFFASCSASRPSSGEARRVVDAHFQLLTQLGAKMTDFRKLNAESKELEGQRIYIYHFLAAAELPAGIAWQDTSGSMIAVTVRGGFVKDLHQKGSVWVGKFTSLPKGTTAVSRGTITFRETEKGWLSSALSADDGYCTDKGPTDCYTSLGWNRLE